MIANGELAADAVPEEATRVVLREASFKRELRGSEFRFVVAFVGFVESALLVIPSTPWRAQMLSSRIDL